MKLIKNKRGQLSIGLIIKIIIAIAVIVVLIPFFPAIKENFDEAFKRESKFYSCNIELDTDGDNILNVNDLCPCDAYMGKNFYHINPDNVSKSIAEKCEGVPIEAIVRGTETVYRIKEDYETDCNIFDVVSDVEVEKYLKKDSSGNILTYCYTPKAVCNEILKEDCKNHTGSSIINLPDTGELI